MGEAESDALGGEFREIGGEARVRRLAEMAQVTPRINAGRMHVVEADPDRSLRSPSVTLPHPIVIRLVQYVRVPRFTARRITRRVTSHCPQIIAARSRIRTKCARSRSPHRRATEQHHGGRSGARPGDQRRVNPRPVRQQRGPQQGKRETGKQCGEEQGHRW